MVGSLSRSALLMMLGLTNQFVLKCGFESLDASSQTHPIEDAWDISISETRLWMSSPNLNLARRFVA